jgi:hypothetical protein
MKRETNLKWNEVTDVIVKMKTQEMVSNYVGNIFDFMFNKTIKKQ